MHGDRPACGSQSTRRRPELSGRFPGIQEIPIMTAETPSAAVPARPAVSLDPMAPSPGRRRPGGHAASGSRARARTGADPAVIDPVARARTGGKRAQASQPALLAPLPQITGIGIAARYRSATPGAGTGGDLY